MVFVFGVQFVSIYIVLFRIDSIFPFLHLFFLMALGCFYIWKSIGIVNILFWYTILFFLDFFFVLVFVY